MSAVQQYRKKPVVIEAAQFTGNESALDILKWSGTPPITAEIDSATGEATALLIDTLEGQMRASVGDYVIKGVQGEFYPCKPDIFAATYEPMARPYSGDVDQGTAVTSGPVPLRTSVALIGYYNELTEGGLPGDLVHELVRGQGLAMADGQPLVVKAPTATGAKA